MGHVLFNAIKNVVELQAVQLVRDNEQFAHGGVHTVQVFTINI
jgi:hypothetical protein